MKLMYSPTVPDPVWKLILRKTLKEGQKGYLNKRNLAGFHFELRNGRVMRIYNDGEIQAACICPHCRESSIWILE
jgi:hypothetical protein